MKSPRSSLALALTLASSLFVEGCGGTAQDSGDGDGDAAGDGDGDGLPGSLNPDKLLTSLTIEEIGMVCDTVTDLYGGYDMELDCGGELTFTSSKSKEACIADSVDLTPTCTATVGDMMSCAEGLTDNCSFTADCIAVFSCVQ